ncbi:MAG: hypothetical protein ACLSHC_09190 [Bilophila wadsworthia]
MSQAVRWWTAMTAIAARRAQPGFHLLADKRDGLFEARLTRALDSCYNCRTEFNCTEVCPKSISGTRAIKYIQRMALKNLKDIKPLPPHPAELAPPKPKPEAQEQHTCSCHSHQARTPRLP